MANELTINLSLSYAKGQIAPVGLSSKSFQVDVAGVGYIRNVESATISTKALAVPENSDPGYCIVHNLDTTDLASHFILIGSNFGHEGGNGVPLLQLGPNEWAVFRLNPDSFPWIGMNPGLTGGSDPTSIQIEYMIVAA